MDWKITLATQDAVEEVDTGSTNDKGQSPRKSCPTVICLLIFVLIFALWIGVGFYAILYGNLAELLQPTNSRGEVCGQANQTGKPFLLYWDLTRCAGISTDVGSCPTPQLCVEECPNTYWSSSQGMASGVEQFCNNLPADRATPISQLVEEWTCPSISFTKQACHGQVCSYIWFGQEGGGCEGRGEDECYQD